MKKNILLLIAGLLSISTTYSQVGINTKSPLVGLHMVPFSTDGSTAEGIIAPNLTRAQLIAKDSKYGPAYKGAFVYITATDGVVTAKTAKIITTGYYYFDGTEWKHFNDKLQQADNGLSVNNASVQLGGPLTKATEVNKGGYTLDLTGAGALNVSGNTTLSDDLIVRTNKLAVTNTGVGIGTINPTTGLHVDGSKSFRYVDGNNNLGNVLTSDANGNAYWAAPGVMVYQELLEYAAIVNVLPSTSFVYSGYSITLPSAGLYMINFGGGLSQNIAHSSLLDKVMFLMTDNPTPSWGIQVDGANEYLPEDRFLESSTDYDNWISLRLNLSQTVKVSAATTLYLHMRIRTSTNLSLNFTVAAGGSVLKVN